MVSELEQSDFYRITSVHAGPRKSFIEVWLGTDPMDGLQSLKGLFESFCGSHGLTVTAGEQFAPVSSSHNSVIGGSIQGGRITDNPVIACRRSPHHKSFVDVIVQRPYYKQLSTMIKEEGFSINPDISSYARTIKFPVYISSPERFEELEAVIAEFNHQNV